MRRRLIWHRHVISLGSAAICMGLLVAIPCLHAQGPTLTRTADGKVPSYDVVSIKPDHTDSGRVSIRIDDGNFDALNVSLKTMILSAYSLKEAQLIDLPKWGDSAHFDIKAKIIVARLADQLSAQLQRVVVDKTGLTANYNFQLSSSPDDAPPTSPDVAAPPDIFTALEEQLGLKLQPGKEEMNTFVIDHVEYPTEN
jgi:hypothetical protein